MQRRVLNKQKLPDIMDSNVPVHVPTTRSSEGYLSEVGGVIVPGVSESSARIGCQSRSFCKRDHSSRLLIRLPRIEFIPALIRWYPTLQHKHPRASSSHRSSRKDTNMATTESTPPPLHAGPTSKEKKYDRQLRLWAAAGQAALEEAHILLINSGPGVTGIETLKNLILPGVGQYTILDSAIVSEADLGVNFFLDESCLGGSRAEHTCKLLQELNPDVQGHFLTEVPLNYTKASVDIPLTQLSQ